MIKEKYLKGNVAEIRTGNFITKTSQITVLFGCNSCGWRDTSMCPNGIKFPATHSNHICSARAIYIKEIFNIAHSKTRVLQVEEAVRLRLLLDKLTHDFTEENILDPNLVKLSKNIISLLDKMRKQDEGLKFSTEVSHSVQDFRKIVEAQAEIVKDKDIVKEAEFIDKPNNREGKGIPGKEV